MKVVYGIGRYNLKIKNPVLVIGVFDGVHAGHQRLIRAAQERARQISGRVIVMTFDPHPVHVLHPEVGLPLIVSLEHRVHLLNRYGVDVAIVVKFTKTFARMSPVAFIGKYLGKIIRPRDVFVGDDFRFGQHRSGGVELFEEQGRKFGFSVQAVRPVKGDVGKVSSTQIRHLVIEGNLRKAARYLGHDVAVMGTIVAGDKRGQKLGFPTANLNVPRGIVPPKGVYATRMEIDGKFFNSMTNVGQRPSFTPLDERIYIETHIFNFTKNVYGKTAVLHFVKKIREERVFSSPDKLTAQLRKDARAAKRALQ